MTETDPYAEFRATEAQASAEAIKQLSDLSDKLLDAERQVAEAEDALKKAQDHRRDIAERQIPELMDQMGLEEYKTNAGLKVKVKEIIRTSIPQKHKDKAFKWLEDNGHGGLIKRTLSVAFARDEQERAAAAQAELKKHFANVKQDMKVEPSTLRSFVSHQLAEGEEIPEDLFGVHRQREAKVETPKDTNL